VKYLPGFLFVDVETSSHVFQDDLAAAACPRTHPFHNIPAPRSVRCRVSDLFPFGIIPGCFPRAIFAEAYGSALREFD
jgi:hypothetical protein